jgi:hypothetical protein
LLAGLLISQLLRVGARGRERDRHDDGKNNRSAHRNTSQKKGATEVAPNITRVESRLELEPYAHAHVERRLELRRVATEVRVDRLAEVRVVLIVVQLRVL